MFDAAGVALAAAPDDADEGPPGGTAEDGGRSVSGNADPGVNRTGGVGAGRPSQDGTGSAPGTPAGEADTADGGDAGTPDGGDAETPVAELSRGFGGLPQA